MGMRAIENLKRFILGKINNSSSPKKAGIPNGWGRQNYHQKNQTVEYNEQLDLNNIKEKKGWIQAYVAEKLNGIQKHSTKKQLFYPYHSITYKSE